MLDIFLMLGVTVLQILDGMTTYEALTHDRAAEGNKFLKAIMDQIGIAATLIISKGLFIGGLSAACLLYPSIYLTVMLGLICCGYVWVVSNNLMIGR